METATDSAIRRRRSSRRLHESIVVGRLQLTPGRRRHPSLSSDVSLSVVSVLLQPLLHTTILLLLSTLLLISFASADQPPSATTPADNSQRYQLPDHIKGSENYEIVIPQRVNENGIAFPKHRHYLRRHKRGTVSDDQSENLEGPVAAADGSIIYRLNAFGKDIDIRLTPDETILVDGLRVQHMATNETWLGADLSQDSPHCFHSGSVNQDPLSVAVLSTCESLLGVIHSFKERYFIEPLCGLSDNADSCSSTDGLAHVIYKWTPPVETSGHADFRHQENVEDLELRHNGLTDDDDDIYPPKPTSPPPRRRIRRYLSQQRFVEVMVVADAEMKRFHGADLEHYLLTLMAIVAHIYKDHSIGNPIKIVVVKVVVLETELAGKMVSKNAATTLRGFCDWQKQVNVANDDDPRHHDTAVLLTKHDICRSNQKCDTLGLAELGTMCDSHRSCSIVKDSGLSAAFTIAHELGHVFSLRHDDECFQFKNRTDLYHIMAPTLDHETKYWSWSECSRNKMTEFLGAGHADCLNDKPPTSVKPFPVLNHDPVGTLMLPGNVYTVDQQCAHIFEPNSVRCPYLPVCIRLWCTNPDAERVGCSTKHMPWADGTPCNESMWCLRGQCVPKRTIRPTDGQWGPWSHYGPCTRSCGGGIQQSTRPCNNPEPDNGGKYCTGRRIKYKSCNHKDCPEGSIDFREQQCSSFNGKHFNINGLTPDVKWVAKYSGIEAKDRCKLFCRVSTNAAYYQLADRVTDGTKCGLDTTDICVMGQCRKAGCDNRLGSSTARDRCGICGGDNSNCQQIKEQFPEGVKIAYGYNQVTRIPKGATNVDIRQYSSVHTKDDDTYLALKNSSGNFVLNGDFIVSAFHKELNVHGSILEYTGSGSTVERINGTGTLLDDIEVYVLTVGELLHRPHIECQYTVRINASNERLYVWSKTTMDWTKCSHLCQGKKVRKVVCLSTKTGAVISDQHCLEIGKKPPDSVKPCHGRCKLSWKVTGEGECAAKCKEKGLIHREIRCHKELLDSTRSDLNTTSMFVAVEHCRHLSHRLVATVDCIGPCLSSRWAYTSWSECSRSCGGGEQKRNAFCMNELGHRLAEEACQKERRVTEQKCNPDRCPHWLSKKWTGCSVSCGSGVQFREVDCVQGHNTTVETRCNLTARPERKRECNAGICPSWDVGKWGQCSTTCGKGVQQRVVKCRSPAGSIIDDRACDAGSRPRTETTCRIATCVTAVTTTLATTHHKRLLAMAAPVTLWRTGGWTECSTSCGSGSRQRYVSCRDLAGNIAADSFCEHLLKPDYIEPCNIRPCGQWRTGDWAHCSVTCGEGRETRLVACMSLEELEEQMPSHSECDIAIKPPTERICNRRDCIQDKQLSIIAISSNNVVGTTVWRAGPWTPCSSTCEDGLQRRRVICQDEKGPSDNCDPDIQPPEQRSCNMGPCPYWNHGEWGQCDVTCGGGSQQRIVHCQLPNSEILPDANCLDFAPPRKQPCGVSACPPARQSRTHWQKGRWSSCSVSCGKGLKQRPVVCVDEAGKQVTDYLCKVQKPKVTTWCRKGRCPFWWSSPWSQCSVTCDAGTRRRTVLCMRGQNRTVDPSRCQHIAQPTSTSPCNVRKCQQFYWVTGNWSECTHPCSFGSQSRNVSCVEMTSGRAFDERFCVEPDKPKPQRDCSMVPCSNIWITSDWTRCSASCGQGLQKRAVSCRAMAREGWLLPGHVGLHACNQVDRPSSERNCSYGDCSSLYHWETTSWSQCSKTCGFGRAYRESYCFNSSGMKHSPNDCEAPLRPSVVRPCYMGPCYSTSCRDVKQHTAWKADGEFNLLVEGKLLPIYCSEMARSHPKEYLTLVADENENYSEIYDKRLAKANTCPENGTRIHHCQKCFRSNLLTAGLTKFSKVRLNLTSLHVIGNDFTFSSTTGKKRIPFATGGDCYSRMGNCPQGKFQVTLSGTRFRVVSNSEWQTFGYKTSKQIDISMDRQIVKGRCGGHCGRCSPNNGFLKLELLP